MKRTVTSIAVLAFAATAVARVSFPQTTQQRIQAQYPVNMKFTNTTLTKPQVTKLMSCKLRFYLKYGMTNAEANSAIDDGYERFFKCLRTASIPSVGRTPG